MNELFLLYLWTRLDAIKGFAIVIPLASMGIAFIIALVDIEYDGFAQRFWKSWRHLAYILWTFSIAVLIFLPSKTDAAIIAGGWLVKEAATSEVAKNIGERTYKLIAGKLDEELAKLEEPKKGEK